METNLKNEISLYTQNHISHQEHQSNLIGSPNERAELNSEIARSFETSLMNDIIVERKKALKEEEEEKKNKRTATKSTEMIGETKIKSPNRAKQFGENSKLSRAPSRIRNLTSTVSRKLSNELCIRLDWLIVT